MSYMAAHNRNRKVRGNARDQICFCGEPAQEWAYMGSADERVDGWGRTYSVDPYEYQAMCFGCHRRYDKAAITKCPNGHEYSGDNVLMDAGKRKCKTCVYERNRRHVMSPASKAKKADYQRRKAQERKSTA